MKYNKTTDVVFAAASSFVVAVTLFLAENKMTTLPATIVELTNLTRFSCKGNPLNLKDPDTNDRYNALKTIVGSKFVGV